MSSLRCLEKQTDVQMDIADTQITDVCVTYLDLDMDVLWTIEHTDIIYTYVLVCATDTITCGYIGRYTLHIMMLNARIQVLMAQWFVWQAWAVEASDAIHCRLFRTVNPSGGPWSCKPLLVAA